MVRLENIIEQVGRNHPYNSADIIAKAYVFCAKAHRGQARRSGAPYLGHPLEVADILAKLRMDAVTVAGGLLHDTVEDTHTTLEELHEVFGEEIAQLVDGVTKIGKMEFESTEAHQAENFRKMILAMAKDIRVIIIKLADRLHNMRTLDFLPAEKRRAIAQETRDIYAPLADRLGMGWLKCELEDIAFKHLEPEAYPEIERKIASKVVEREKLIKEMTIMVEAELRKAGIPGRIEGRPKHFWSIYLKMRKQGITFDEVYDVIGLRIITDEIKNCYGILGLIHSHWTPIPGRFKDFIAMPKANMYQSLHTTVIGPRGERVEFQIRTEEMHLVAEEGIAAHWRYKEGLKIDEQGSKKFTWLRHLLEWQRELKDPKEFLNTVKIDLFPDEVYVFTPKGAVKGFPRGATPVDFAYAIHTEIGNKCMGAKVNGRMVSLKYQLKNGDIVEIITSQSHKPTKDWLKFVKTSRARAKIKAFIKIELKERSKVFGRELFEKELARAGLNLSEAAKAKASDDLPAKFGYQSMDDLMAAIGYGKVSAKQVISKLIPPEIEAAKKIEGEAELKEAPSKLAPTLQEAPVKVAGIDDVFVRFAKCCNPVPGEEIVGFITRGRGVSVHTADCPSLSDLELDPERRVDVEWDFKLKTGRQVKIVVESVDRKGILSKVSSAIASSDSNISQAKIYTTDDERAFLEFSIEVSDLEHLRRVMRAIEAVDGVLGVQRIKSRAAPLKGGRSGDDSDES